MRGLGHRLHEGRAGQLMHPVDRVEHPRRRFGHRLEMVGGPTSHSRRQLAMGLFAQGLDHLAGIDAHWTQRRTEAVGGAGVHALIAVFAHQSLQRRFPFASCHPPTDLPPANDPLPGGEGQVFRRTDRLTEAAFDAFVHQLMGRRQGLEIFDVRFQIAVNDHAGIEQPLGIKQLLDRLH